MTDETPRRHAIRGDTTSIRVDLVDTLVTDFDVIDVLTELTAVAEAIVARTLDLESLTAAPPAAPTPTPT